MPAKCSSGVATTKILRPVLVWCGSSIFSFTTLQKLATQEHDLRLLESHLREVTEFTHRNLWGTWFNRFFVQLMKSCLQISWNIMGTISLVGNWVQKTLQLQLNPETSPSSITKNLALVCNNFHSVVRAWKRVMPTVQVGSYGEICSLNYTGMVNSKSVNGRGP